MRYIAIILAIGTLLFSSTSYSEIANLYDQGNYAKVYKKLKKLANQGELKAQLDLAKLYINGDGVKKSYKKAKYWLQKCSKKSSEAKFTLATFYLKGLGVDKNYTKATTLFKEASKKGNSSADYNLGVIYEKGIGVKRDINNSITYYKRSANRGNIDAQYNLAAIYYNKKPKNIKKAIYWYKKAAIQGDVESLYNMGWFYANGKGVLKNKIKAFNYWIEASKRSHQKAQNELDKLCKTSPWACR